MFLCSPNIELLSLFRREQSSDLLVSRFTLDGELASDRLHLAFELDQFGLIRCALAFFRLDFGSQRFHLGTLIFGGGSACVANLSDIVFLLSGAFKVLAQMQTMLISNPNLNFG